MKRYKLIEARFYVERDINTALVEDPEGEWVRWEDVKELLGKLGHEASTAENNEGGGAFQP